MFQPTFQFNGFDWSTSLKKSIFFNGQPAHQRLKWVVLECIATVANASGAGADVYPRQLARLFSGIEVDTPTWKVRATGRLLWNKYRHMCGKSVSNAKTTIANGNSATVRTFIYVPATNLRIYAPNDSAQDTALLANKSIEVTCADSNVIATGVTVTAMKVQPTGFYEPSSGDVVPAKFILDYVDIAGGTGILKGGLTYATLHIYDESDDVVTLSEYSKLRLRFDGRDVIDNLPTSQLVNAWNHLQTFSSAQDNETDELPADNLLFLPVYTAEEGVKLSKLPSAFDGGQLDITGTASGGNTRIAFSGYEHQSQGDHERAMALLGVRNPAAAARRPKTLSKAELTGPASRVAHLTSLLPLRFSR